MYKWGSGEVQWRGLRLGIVKVMEAGAGGQSWLKNSKVCSVWQESKVGLTFDRLQEN